FNRQSSIKIQKCLWRRGWDSNPRNGSPFTAFPVLPIQPLLHLSSIVDCRFPIADWSRVLWRTSIEANRKSTIGNRQCSWRRGWDSNPRWALTHSGFRDRCTNPLCDLSACKPEIGGQRSEVRDQGSDFWPLTSDL